MNPNITLQEAAEAYLNTLPRERIEEANKRIKNFMEWCGPDRRNQPLTSFTPHDIESYAEHVAKPGGDYVKKLEPVKIFLQCLKKQNITESNYAVHLKPPTSPLKARKVRTHQAGGKETKVLTREGYTELKSQLEQLKREIPRLTEEITRAREDKDIRENAPLESAREAQALVQSKILELESTLKVAVIMEENGAICGAKASIGNTVCLKNEKTGDTAQYKLVDPNEADPSRGKISFISPLGKCILGRSAGEVVEVKAPIGLLRYKIETVGS